MNTTAVRPLACSAHSHTIAFAHVGGAKVDEIFGENWAGMERIEWTANAGDAIFWHSLIFHSGSANINDVPRLAIFARWHHRDMQAARFPDEQQGVWRGWDGYDESHSQPARL